jgi:hypothetical protein
MRAKMKLTKRLKLATQTLCAIVALGLACPALAGDTVGLPAPTSRPMRGATSQLRFFGAIPICTPGCRWTRAPSELG